MEDDKKEATIEAVKGIIAAEGEVGNADAWGMRKLAYPIQKKSEGYYVVIEFKAQPTSTYRSSTEDSRSQTT